MSPTSTARPALLAARVRKLPAQFAWRGAAYGIVDLINLVSVSKNRGHLTVDRHMQTSSSKGWRPRDLAIVV